jgi:serine/threonine protein kinase
LEYKDNQTIILTNGQETKRNIVIMKYMTNGDLMNEVLRNGRIDSKILLKIVRPLVDCLTYLSKRETFHCDLKPENILLSEEYQPLLIDFGFVATQFLSK